MGESEGSVQPEGQGADSGESGGGFYQEYLQNEVPEDYREHVEPYLRSIESNANEKFREHAEYRKQYEPYDELNLSQYEPEGLANLLAFAELMEDEEKFKEWVTETGQKLGIGQELNQGDEFDDGDDGEFGELDLDTIRTAFGELLDDRLGPLEERLNSSDQERQSNEANQIIETKMEELHEQHGDFDEQAVYKLAFALSESSDDPIQAGFDEYQRIVGNIQTETVNGQVEQPAPPERGGGPANTNQKPPTDFAEASKMAKERLAQLHG